MLIFHLTIHHLWERVLTKYPQTRALPYADDGYIKTKLNVVLQVLVELKHVLKEDVGLELHNVSNVVVGVTIGNNWLSNQGIVVGQGTQEIGLKPF